MHKEEALKDPITLLFIFKFFYIEEGQATKMTTYF